MYKRNGKKHEPKKKPAGKISKTSGQKNAGKEEDPGNLEFTMETGKSISAISRRVAAMSNEGWRALEGLSFFTLTTVHQHSHSHSREGTFLRLN